MLAASYWETHLEWNPMQATELGDRRFDDRLRDYTPAARDRETAALTELRARVDAVPSAALPPADRVTRALLLGEIDAELACALVRAGRLVGRPARRAAGRPPAPGRAAAGADAGRGPGAGGALAEDGRRDRAEHGQPAPRAGGGQGRHRATRSSACWGSWTSCWPSPTPSGRCARPRARRTPTGRPRSGSRSRARSTRRSPPRSGRRSSATGRCCATRSCRAPATTRTPASCNVPGGAACYERLIKVHTSLALPAEEIHRIGLEEVARIHAEMARRAGRRSGDRRSLPELKRRLRADSGAYFRTRAEVEAAAREALRARAGRRAAFLRASRRGRRAWSSASRRSRRRTRPSPTTGRRPSTAAAPAPTTSTRTRRRRARATRPRRWRSTSRSPGTTSRSRSRRS